MPTDPYVNNAGTLTTQPVNFADAVPSDSADLAVLPKALRVKAEGDLRIAGADGTIVTFPVFAGETLPIRPTRIYATGTTATIVLLF